MTSKTFYRFPVSDFNKTKLQMLNWADQFNICCFLDNHNYQIAPHSFECLLAVGSIAQIESSAGDALNKLKKFSNENHDWIFGHFGYDLKVETEKIQSNNFDGIGFPDLFFFVPEIIIKLEDNFISIAAEDAESVLNSLQNFTAERTLTSNPVHVRERFSKQEYIDTVEEIKKHILRGDCYELNFCVEFFKEDADLDPLSVYLRLAEISPNPFSVYYKLNDKYLLCASPERYLRKSKNKLISQPVKGTSKRSLIDPDVDLQNKIQLRESPKEQSENVMIVDLVRNDLSRVCEEGSVKVEELFGVYDFPQVHQMISTITGELRKDLHWNDAIKETFPMGSMTGAPKRKVIELIEKFERTKRG
ncbi:MAG TPA: anthranilate synthase component I family protein, partial [Chitinophagaceae bacterium]|nr:anthranilate synthase component I family protein [Chitinophagaceae bacterium]